MTKKVLPLLLCYVLTATQVFALSGGPVFTSGVSVIGTYSGIIQGVTETNNDTTSGPAIPGDPTAPNNSNTVASNALGLFSLGIPATSVATGAFLLFADGYVFTGTITASADPDNDKLSGILEGTFSFTLNVINSAGTVTAVATTAQALGKINAKIANSRQGSVSAARLTGTANLDINFGTVDPNTLEPIIDRVITFTVSGFKQSNTATTSNTIGTATGTTGTGGAGTG